MDNIVKSTLVNKLDPNSDHDEQPVSEKVVHQFYFVKFRQYNDPHSDFLINTTQKLMQNLHHQYLANKAKYNEIKKERYQIWRCNKGNSCNWKYSEFMYWKTREIDLLHDALNTLKSVKKSCRKKALDSWSHEKFDQKNLYFGLHKTNNLISEKRLLREINGNQEQKEVNACFDLKRSKPYITRAIRHFVDHIKTSVNGIFEDIKEIENRRKKSIVHATANGRSWDPLDSERAIKDEIRLINKIGKHLDKEKLATNAQFDKDLKHFNEEIKRYSDKSDFICQKWDESNKIFLQLTKKRDETNKNYIEYTSVMQNATQFAQQRDLKGLEELSRDQVDIFMTRWIVSKSFRANYTK